MVVGGATQAGITEKDWLCKCIVPLGQQQPERMGGRERLRQQEK